MATFPDIDFLTEHGAPVRDLTGTFWVSFYDGIDFVDDFHQARDEASLQTRLDLTELIKGIERANAPILRRVRKLPLTIKESERKPISTLIYNSGDLLGGTSSSTLSGRTFDYPIPANLREASVIVDDLINPSNPQVENLDYTLDFTNKIIRFQRDPILNQPVEAAFDNLGNVIDNQTTLWLLNAGVEIENVYDLFGYLVGIPHISSPRYRDLINAISDAALLGPTNETLRAALAAISDAPKAVETETVVDIDSTEENRLLIITDKRVYFAGVNATAVVSVGDTVQPGDRLTDAYEFIELAGTLPSPSKLASITIPKEWLHDAGFTGGLTFSNTTVPLIVTIDAGRTRVEFSLGGAPADAALFWDLVHSKGTAVGATSLAQLLDLRPPPQTTDPDVNSLPLVINPMEFLIDNVLAYNTAIIKLVTASFGSDELHTILGEAKFLDIFRRHLVGPQAAVIFETT